MKYLDIPLNSNKYELSFNKNSITNMLESRLIYILI